MIKAKGIATIVAVIALLFFFSYFIMPDQTILAIKIIVILVILFGLLFGILSAYFYAKHRQAELKTKEYKAKSEKYISYQDGHGMTHLLNLKTDTIENLTAFPGTHHNGKWEEPPPAAAAAWYAVISKKSETPVNLLPTGPTPQLPDLLTVFTQPSQSYAIVAGQQVGKTYQAQRVAEYWLRQNSKPIVIGPKRDKGEWAGCVYFGEGYNFDKVTQGMRIIKKLAEQRHKNKTMGHKQHPIQPVFFDDWTSTKQQLDKEAERFIVEATVLYASVNIILYFILHTDTANAWGVGKVGAALKNNFIKLIIEPGYDKSGLINRRHNKGFLIRPGETNRDRKPVKLFDSVPASQIIVDNPDNQFVNLVGQGETRQNAAMTAYGKNYAGTSFVSRCKGLLNE